MKSVGIGVGLGAIAAAVGQLVPPLVITPVADLFFDTFDGSNASLTGRAGWTVYGDAPRAALIKADGGVARMNTVANGDDPRGFQISPGVTGSKAVELEYDWSQENGDVPSDPASPYRLWFQRIIIAWQDATNYTYITFSRPSAPLFRMEIIAVVAGNGAVIGRYDGLPATATLRFQMTDRLRVHVGNILWPSVAILDGRDSYPDRIFDGATIRNGGAGFQHNFFPVAFSKVLRINPALCTVSDPEQFYGRDATNKRAITFTGTYSGTPASWAYRLRNRSDDSVSVPWTAITPTASAGTWSATINVQSGGPYFIDVAWIGADGFARIGTSSSFAVGILVMVWGQSNAGYGGFTTSAFTDPTGTMAYGYDLTPAKLGTPYERWWCGSEIYSAGYLVDAMGVAKSLSAATNIPVGVLSTGVAGQALADLKPGTPNWTNVLLPAIAAAGGNVEQWIWSQGESEGLGESSSTNYVADFASLVAGLRSAGGRADAGVYIRVIGKYTTSPVNATTTARAQAFRTLQMGLENPADDIWISSCWLGLPLRDDIHPTPLAQVEINRRDGLTIARRGYGSIGYDGRGPLITGATRSGATITLAVDLNGATSISGTALTGYAVSTDDFATTLPISSVNVSGGSIVITLASAPAGAVKVRSYREANYDDSSIAVGAYADGTTIGVFPIVNPITST